MEMKVGRDTLLALAAVAWADGKLAPQEAAGIQAAVDQLGLSSSEATAVQQALTRPISLDEVETVRMQRLTRLFTYSVAVWMAQLDGGVISPSEQKVLDVLGDRLGLSGVARERARNVALGQLQASGGSNPGNYDLLRLKNRLSAGLSQIGDE